MKWCNMKYSKEELLVILDKNYKDTASKNGRLSDRFPYGFINEDSGIPYIEINHEGKLSLVAKDRGQECFRKEFQSIEEIVEWVYDDFVKARARWTKFESEKK